jgi:hypothetical protein
MTQATHAAAEAGPRRRARASWAELQQRRRHNRFHQLLDHSFGFRLLMAATGAVLLLGGVNRWEQCRTHGFASGCVLNDPGGIVNVSNVESLSIVTAAFLFLLEGGKRRQREHLEAMEVILSCQQAGVRLSHARNGALERLSESGLWLDGLDLSGTHLDDLQVPHARWRQVNLRNASLQRACLADADLQLCDLSDADLSQANLQHADLRGANLRGANLRGADLSHADLRDADTTEIALDGATLHGADLRGTAQEGADRPSSSRKM